MHAYMCVYVCKHMCLCKVYVYMCERACICEWVSAWHMCGRMCVHVCVCACMCISGVCGMERELRGAPQNNR